MEGRLGSHAWLAFSLRTVIRKEVVGMAISGCGSCSSRLPKPLCSGQLWDVGHVGAGS